MKTRLDLIKNWIIKADNDLKSAHHELSFNEEAVTEAICFHCQQAVEKYLKAYLIFLDIPFKKIHEIGELILLCETKDNEIGAMEDEADILTDYAVNTRYPDSLFMPVFEEAQEAAELAKKIKEYVLKKMAGKIGQDSAVEAEQVDDEAHKK